MKFRRSTGRLLASLAVTSVLLAACGSDNNTSTATDAPVVSDAPAGTDAPATPGTAAAPDTTVADTTPATDPPATIAKGGTLTVGLDADSSCGYLPSSCSVSYGAGAARFAVLENLVRPANNSDGWEPQLAESVTPNADFTQFTFNLRPGVKWSDGTPFTAGDVKTLFDTYVTVEGSFLRGNVGSVTGVEAPDDATVVFTLAAPQAPFPVLLTNVPIWKPEPGQDNTTLPIGTGPFVFDSWEANVKLVLKKNPTYWGTDADGNQLPYLDELDFVPVTSGDTRVNSLESGDIDLAMSTDPLISGALRERSTAYEVGLNAGNGLFFNNSSAPTDDLRVRQALAYATNKDDIMAAIGGGKSRDEYYVPESSWYSAEASKATPGFDVTEAQRLIDEYVNDPARSDGKPAGTPLTIDISVIQGAVTPESIAAVAQQQWQAIGVEVTITPKDQTTLIQDAIAGNFNVNYFGWATPHPYSLLTRNYGEWPATPSNYTHFNSPELIDIVAKMSVAASQDEMDALIQQSNLIIAKGVPLIFLHSTPLVWGTNDAVGNVDLLPGNGFIDWTTLSVAG
jgi:peptide/nickel transport system substrate-binding protein